MLERIAAIQGLRGVAALLVVCLHALIMVQNYSQLSRYGTPNTLLNQWPVLHILGSAGVDLFFVISGFIMVQVTQTLQPGWQQAANFLLRRGIRIYPMYWVYTTLFLSVYWLQPALVHRSLVMDWPWVASSFLLFPYPDSLGNYHPVLIVGWTLLYEMCFYLLFSLALCFLSATGRWLFVASLVLGLMVLGYMEWLPTAFFGSSLWLEFCYGMAIAVVLRGSWQPSMGVLRLGFLLSIAGIGYWTVSSMLGQEAWRGLLVGLPVAGLVWWLVGSGWQSPFWLNRLGDASYSLYLSHFFVQVGVGRLWIVCGLADRWPVEVLIFLAIFSSIVAAQVSYRYLEMPLQVLLRRFIG